MPIVRRFLLFASFAIITVFMLSSVVCAASVRIGIITGDVVNLRANPDLSSKILAQLEKGKQVTVTGSEGEWFKVSVNDATGWVNDKYLVIRDIAMSTGLVTGSVVNVRSKPDISSDIIAKFEKGTKVDIYERSGDWYRVSVGDERFGWINGEYLSVRNTTVSRGLTNDVKAPVSVTDENGKTGEEDLQAGDAEEGTAVEKDTAEDDGDNTSGLNEKSGDDDGAAADKDSAESIRQQIVAYAKKFIGVRYVYGGSTPKGFDCSGFVSYVFKHFGINLERASRDMAAGGKAVKREDLQPGDLVFFDTNGGLNSITHVGIYIGSNKFIHASSSSIHRVTISSLGDTYYARRYMRARNYLSE